MKSLFWKELRQLAPWGVLLFAAMSAIMVGSLYSESEKYYYSLYSQAWFQVWLVIVFGAPCTAFVIGVLQTVLEVRRDQWAFLLHRGLSPTQIFLTKAGAGLAVYMAATLLPTSMGFTWCAWGGIERNPLSWYHALPLLASFLASMAFYFAAILAVVWKGPWYLSRLLPLVAPVLMVVGAVAYASDVTEYVPARIFAAIILAVGVLGVATWGVFVRSGEAEGRSRAANICLGIPVFVAMFGGCLCLFAVAAAAYELLAARWHLHQPWYARPYTGVTVDRDGHILQVTTVPIRDSRRGARQFQRIDDLDEPQSTRYAPLMGQEMSTTNSVPAWDPLPMAHVRESSQPFAFLKRSGSPPRILEQIGGRAMMQKSSLTWVYSSADGWIYGYLQEYETRDDGRMRPIPPRLVEVVGPDGFVSASQRPPRRFGKLLANTGYRHDRLAYDAWPELSRVSGVAARYCLLFEDGLFVIDAPAHAVRRLLVPPAGRKIRCLTKLGDAVAVVYDDSISVHTAMPIIIGTRQDRETATTVDESIDVPGDLQYSFPIPPEVAQFGSFSFGRVPGRDAMMFQIGPDLSTFNSNRFIETRLDGTIVRSRDVLNPGIPTEEAPPILSAMAIFAPPAPVLATAAFDEFRQVVRGTAPGACARLFRRMPTQMSLVAAILIGSALFCGWSAGRTARRYGFDVRTRRAWQWTAAALGPAALLTLWFLRDWPALEKCLACSNRRPVDRELCPHCGAPAAPPRSDGTEIIISEPAHKVAALA
jgi:hypothetical protein